VKALPSTAGSAPGACPVEEQVEEPTALADPKTTTLAPRVITVDKNAASPKVEASLKAAGMLPASVELRQVKLGFFSVETAGRTLQGDEAMHMIRKGQMKGMNKGDVTGQKGEGRRNSPRTTYRRNSKKV
jgi:transposase, IS6 family